VNFKKFDRRLRGKDLVTHKIEAVDAEGAFFYYQVWNSIIQAYSSTRLTKGSDKLIALSGVAKYFMKLIGDDYVVGMWRKYLTSSLLWHVDSKSQVDKSPSARPSLYRAPSFSWAAVDGVVSTMNPKTRKTLFEVIDVSIDYRSSDPTSLVSGGYIELKGVLRPFEMIVKTPWNSQQLFMSVDGNIVKDPAEPYWSLGPLVHLDVGQESFDEENAVKTLYYMPTQEQEKDGDYMSYLLLIAVDSSRCVFRRLGLAVTGRKSEIDILQRTASHADGGACTFKVV
jgi:hypothetical protein